MTYLNRNCRQTTYPDGRVETFNPLVTWHFITCYGGLICGIGIGQNWGIGVLWGYRNGYTVYRRASMQIGRLNIYLNLGRK